LQKEIDKIIREYEEYGIDDWTFDNVLTKLDARELIEIINTDDTYNIYV
jgi:hypothetical protein